MTENEENIQIVRIPIETIIDGQVVTVATKPIPIITEKPKIE